MPSPVPEVAPSRMVPVSGQHGQLPMVYVRTQVGRSIAKSIVSEPNPGALHRSPLAGIVTWLTPLTSGAPLRHTVPELHELLLGHETSHLPPQPPVKLLVHVPLQQLSCAP